MLQRMIYQAESVTNHSLGPIAKPVTGASDQDEQLDNLFQNLNGSSNWGERQRAARKLGYLKEQQAVSPLLTALPGDPFWMVRLAIIQALEKIGDPRAIPSLRRVERSDPFQAVRHQAAKAIATLSS